MGRSAVCGDRLKTKLVGRTGTFEELLAQTLDLPRKATTLPTTIASTEEDGGQLTQGGRRSSNDSSNNSSTEDNTRLLCFWRFGAFC